MTAIVKGWHPSFSQEFYARIQRRKAEIKAEGWGLTPAWWEAKFRPSFLGGGTWFVSMNGWVDGETCATMEAAQLEAARLNYTRGSYSRPTQYGLDGIE